MSGQVYFLFSAKINIAAARDITVIKDPSGCFCAPAFPFGGDGSWVFVGFVTISIPDSVMIGSISRVGSGTGSSVVGRGAGVGVSFSFFPLSLSLLSVPVPDFLSELSVLTFLFFRLDLLNRKVVLRLVCHAFTRVLLSNIIHLYRGPCHIFSFRVLSIIPGLPYGSSVIRAVINENSFKIICSGW